MIDLRSKVRLGWLSLGAALLACGPSEREQAAKVQVGVEKARTASSNRPADIRKAADDLARLDLKDPKAKTARDLCVTAYYDRARYYGLVTELETDVKKPLDKDPKLLAEQFREVDELNDRLAKEIERCSHALDELDSGE